MIKCAFFLISRNAFKKNKIKRTVQCVSSAVRLAVQGPFCTMNPSMSWRSLSKVEPHLHFCTNHWKKNRTYTLKQATNGGNYQLKGKPKLHKLWPLHDTVNHITVHHSKGQLQKTVTGMHWFHPLRLKLMIYGASFRAMLLCHVGVNGNE